MNKAEKVEFGNELKEKFLKANLVIFTNYKGVTASEMDDFRRTLRENNAEVRVVKNNIARKAVAEGFDEDVTKLMDELVGPSLVTFAFGDAAVVAKEISKFAKEHEAMELKPSLMGLKRLEAEDVKALGDLPSREVLLAMLFGTMVAPARDFVSVLAAVPRGLVTVLDAIAKKKEA